MPTTRRVGANAIQAVIRTPRPFSELCKITLVDGTLRAETVIPAQDIGISSLAYGDLYLLQLNNGPPDFQTAPLKAEDGSMLIDSIIVNSNTQITFQRVLGNTTMIFTQWWFPPGVIVGGRGGDLPIGFSVSIRNSRGGPITAAGRQGAQGQQLGIPVSLKPIVSEDFSHFITEHPDETNQYLRPILRSFQCEYLVAPTEWELVQLFPKAFKPDDATIKETKSLLEKLDSDSPDDRQATSAKLKEMGPIAAAILAQVDPKSMSPEQATQVAVLCKDRLTDQQVSDLSKNTDFLISCLNDSRRPVRAAALAALQKLIGHDVSFDLGIDDSANRSLAVETLRKQLAEKPSPQEH